jgi:beta-barrel assembly-enhancing protease
MPSVLQGDQQPPSGFRFSPRLIIALVIAAISIIGYFGHSYLNPVTGRKQHLALSEDEEVALGLQSAPEMAAQFGGLSQDPKGNRAVMDMGFQLAKAVEPDAANTPFKFEYHLLADTQTVNAFALPGGQIFITQALFDRLETPGQLAGVLGHETGHVLARHSSEQMAKTSLIQGLTTSAVVAGSDRRGGYASAAIAQFVGQFALLSYSRKDELEADRLGVRFMARAGYDPRSMIDVMHVLEQASGGGRAPDFMATHPNPEHRIEEIDQDIRAEFPQGLPPGLTK